MIIRGNSSHGRTYAAPKPLAKRLHRPNRSELASRDLWNAVHRNCGGVVDSFEGEAICRRCHRQIFQADELKTATRQYFTKSRRREG